RAVAVRVPLVLAQVHVQAGGELATEGHVHDHQRQEVRMGARHTQVARGDDGLGGAELIDEIDGGARGLVRAGAGRALSPALSRCTRSTSCSGKAALASTSASRSRAAGQWRDSTSVLATTFSRCEPTLRRAAMKSLASAMSKLERRVVPSVSSRVVKDARPGR